MVSKASCSAPRAKARAWPIDATFSATIRDSRSFSIAAAAIAPVTATSSSTASNAAPRSRLGTGRLIASLRP